MPKTREILVNWRSPTTMKRCQVAYKQNMSQKYVDGRQLVQAVAQHEEKDQEILKIFYDDAAEPLNGASKSAIKITIQDSMLNNEDTDVWVEVSVYLDAPEPKKDKKKKKKKASSSDGKQHSPAKNEVLTRCFVDSSSSSSSSSSDDDSDGSTPKKKRKRKGKKKKKKKAKKPKKAPTK